jgi:hypothetical protein
LTAESKLQKQLGEKEKEMKDLMNEGIFNFFFASYKRVLGQKLSKQIAKQSKELKRLRDLEKEFEALNYKLNESTEEVERRTELEAQLKGTLSNPNLIFVCFRSSEKSRSKIGRENGGNCSGAGESKSKAGSCGRLEIEQATLSKSEASNSKIGTTNRRANGNSTSVSRTNCGM